MGTCGTTTTTYATLGDNTSALDPTTSYQAFVDMVKIIGRHTLKIGFDGRQYRLSIENFGNSSGAFGFGPSFVNAGSGNTGAASSVSFGGDFADFYFGIPTAGQYDIPARADYHEYYTGSFIQDDWCISDHLTLNLGRPFRHRHPLPREVRQNGQRVQPHSPHLCIHRSFSRFQTPVHY